MWSRGCFAFFVALQCALLPATVAQGAADADDFYEMVNGGEKMAAALEALPYVSQGQGPVMYTLEFSECPYCQGMYRDYKTKEPNIEFRTVFVPVSDRSAKEAAAMGKSRSIQDYHAFMTGSKRAPAFERDSASIQAFNSIISGTDEIEAVLKQNGWPRPGLVYPQFTWIENGKLFTSGGYEKADFGKAVARAKQGGATAEVWAQFASGKAGAAAQPAAATASSAPRQSTGMDVIGVEIGMTQAEVIAAIKAHDPRMRIGEHPLKIIVQDSNKQQHEIGSYLRAIQAFIGHGYGIEGFNLYEEPTEKIIVYFSPPPAEHRVEFIGREVTYPPGKGPDFHATLESIARKYGEPTQTTGDITGAAKVGLVSQVWQESGTYLEGRQFFRWSNKSGLMAPLNLKVGNAHFVGGPRLPVSDDRTGLSLGILVNKQGQLVHMMRFMLTDDKQAIEQRQAATWDLGQAAIQQQEQKIRGAAQERGGPKL